MKIGVLALQGDFQEHKHKLSGIGVNAVEVRLPSELDGLGGLIIPGGESTTFAKLAAAFGLMEPLRSFGQTRAVWGTCAGAIFLANDIGRDQPILSLMDITVERNAFGRQADSFETDLDISVVARSLGVSSEPFHAVFIRAPIIRKIGPGVDVLARLEDGTIVAAQQGSLLATSFHPELTGDDRFHKYFVRMAGATLVSS